jgi:hypothetical protein
MILRRAKRKLMVCVCVREIARRSELNLYVVKVRGRELALAGASSDQSTKLTTTKLGESIGY